MRSEASDNPFYQSLIIIGNATQQRINLVQKNIDALLDMQGKEGSWKSPEMLQFPFPYNTEPWNDLRRLREDSYD